MSPTRLLPLAGLLLLGGCLWPVREKTDQSVRALASRPYDLVPEAALQDAQRGESGAAPAREGAAAPTAPTPAARGAAVPASDVQTTAFLQPAGPLPGGRRPEYELTIPPIIPGSEAPPVEFEKRDREGKIIWEMTPQQKEEYIRKLYPPLPALSEAPRPLPVGLSGRPYSLSDLQHLAAENSPTLRQAAADVENARGALVQAKTWTNPTMTYSAAPTNNNSNAGAQGFGIDQPIHTGGKWKMQVAVAQKNLDNAELALRRARSDLATAVRTAYFGVLVAAETVRVSGAVARFTDEIYRLYTGYLKAGFVAGYEPAALRAQAYATRLAYKQAISTYLYAWKQLVAALGLPQLPLTEVAGRVDRLIPSFDYDRILAHALTYHTDVLTARNALDTARYNLKLAQITPWFQDIDVNFNVWKESTLFPYTMFYQTTVGMPIPLWDQNKGNIISAQAAMARASEESHRVALTLTSGLAAAYTTYKNNLDALEYYRRYVLPDYVRAYRGAFERRSRDPNANPGDLVAAQATLSAGVTTYLGILGSLWTAVVNVADYLQTDDLFQVANPHELPELPDLEHLFQWPCPHGHADGAPCACCPAAGPPAPQVLPGGLPPPPGQSPTGSPSTPPASLPEQLPVPRKP